MTIWAIFLCSMAFYRVSHMIALETGPFGVFWRIREKIGKRYGYDHWLSDGSRCPLCISFWLSALVLLAGGSLIEWLGIAGIILVIHTFLYKR